MATAPYGYVQMLSNSIIVIFVAVITVAIMLSITTKLYFAIDSMLTTFEVYPPRSFGLRLGMRCPSHSCFG